MTNKESERSPRGTPPPPPATDRPLTVTMYDPKSPDAQVREATTYDGKQVKTRKRKTMSSEERAKVALVRRLGACDVCKARRVRCSPDHHRDSSRFNQNKESSSSVLSSEASVHRPLQILPAFAQASHMPGYINEQSILSNVGARFQNTERVEPAAFNRDPAFREESQSPAKRPASNGALSVQAMTGVEPSSPAPGSAITKTPPAAFSNEAYMGRMRHGLDLESFGKSLEDAVKLVLPDQSSRYTSVHVLVLQWEVDISSQPLVAMCPQVAELVRVFIDIYNFEVEIGFIPREQPSKWISRKMINFVDKADDSLDSLKILYYGGHSFISASRENIWSSGSGDPRNCVLNMKSVQDMLEEANSDALLILDACAPGSSISSSTGRGATELIAARTWNQEASSSPFAFTEALVTELRQLAHKPSFSVAYLYNQLFHRLQNRVEVDDQKSARPRILVPIHLILSSDNPRSIMLAPLKSKPPLENANLGGPVPLRNKSGGEAPRFLISIQVLDVGENPSVDLFTEWLRGIPAAVADIKVEAGFQSF